jgi:phage protein D
MRAGVDVTDRFNDRTTEIKVELSAGNGEQDKCQITIDDRDWLIARPVNESLDIWLGYQEVGMSYMGSFEIDDITFQGPPRSIMMTGLASGMRSVQKAPAIANFDNKSVGDIIGSMAAQSGLGVAIDSGLAANMIPFKNQSVSNMHLLHELERQFGAVAKISNGKIIFTPRDGTTSASGISMPTLVLLPEHFGTWSVKYNSRTDYAKVKAAWRDKADGIRRWVETGVGTSAGSDGGETFPLGQLFNSMGEAQAAAQAKSKALKRFECQANFDLAKGDPWVKDAQTLVVSGMREGINGSYTIDKATHTYVKRTGIRTTLECKSPGTGADFSDRADENFLKPEPGELLGEVLKNGTFQGMPTWDQFF